MEQYTKQEREQTMARFHQLTPRTYRSDVAEAIRTAILNGTLPPGAPLVERRIAEEMGVSRAPVREALRKLEEQGLVVTLPYKGTYVTQMGPDAMRQLVEVRKVLEVFAVEQSLPQLQKEGLTRLHQQLEEMGTRAEMGEADVVNDLHLDFHRTFYEYADHPLLLQMWKVMENQLRVFLRIHQHTYDDLISMVKTHQKVLSLVERGDLEALQREIEQHLLEHSEQLVRWQQDH